MGSDHSPSQTAARNRSLDGSQGETRWLGFSDLAEWEKVVEKLSHEEIEDLRDWQADYSDESLAAFKRMHALSPKHRSFVYIIRLNGANIKKGRIAEILGINRSSLWKMFEGKSDKETVVSGEAIEFKSPGAYDIFRALYTPEYESMPPLDKLKADNQTTHSIISARDFSASDKATRFSTIANRNGLTKAETLDLYFEGWRDMGYDPRSEIKESGEGGSSQGEGINENEIEAADYDEPDADEIDPAADSDQEEIDERSAIAMKSETAPRMIHPDSTLLLSYIEHDLEKETRSRVHRHLLICGRCAQELRFLESALFEEESLLERLGNLAAEKAARLGEEAVKLAELLVVPRPALVRNSNQEEAEREYILRIPRLVLIDGDRETEYKYLTIIDEDENRDLYLFLEPQVAIFSYPVEDEHRTSVPELPDCQPHRLYIFLTDKPVALPEGVKTRFRYYELRRRQRR